jgi:hypothetical protein
MSVPKMVKNGFNSTFMLYEKGPFYGKAIDKHESQNCPQTSKEE